MKLDFIRYGIKKIEKIDMKKVLLSLVAVGLLSASLISCQSNQKGKDEAGADSTGITAVSDTTKVAGKEVTATKGSDVVNVSPNVEVKTPQFSSEDVNVGFAKFEPLKQEYIAAINSKDAAKIKEVTAKYNAWVVDAASWGSKLPKDENQIYIDHYTKLAIQWDKLTPKVAKVKK